MDPVSSIASISAVLELSSWVIRYLNDVKHAPKEYAKCAAEAANLHGLLTNLRFRLEEGDSKTSWYTAVRVLAVENGPLDQFKQALEQLQKKINSRGRIGKAGNALVWKFKKEEIAIILGRIERLKTLVGVALEMDHFKLSQAMKESGDATRNNTELIRDDTSFIRHETNHAHYSKVITWLSPTDFPAQQSDIISRRQQGTGQWFLDASEVAQWLRESKRTLFCPGMPGAGKTMIAAIAIDHLLKTVKSSSVGIAYVYCNYKAQEEQSPGNLLAAILKQLVHARPSLVDPVNRLYTQHINRGTRPSVEDILTALLDVLAKFSAVYVVIDAVDECRESDGTRSLFLAKLQDLQAQRDIRIMFTSRIIPDIANGFKTALRLEVRVSDEDVKRFVAGQVHRLPRCIQRDAVLQKMVQDKTTEAVNGMFLLARLYTDSLLDKRTPKEVKSTLDKFSKGSTALDDAYGGAIQRIEGQLSGDLEQAKKVLSWITYAKRPLNTAEMCCALAVESEARELDPENVPEIEDLVSVCAGLVEVDPESAVIRLVHYTAQEYFERIMEQWKPGALLEITSTCLTYLCFDAFKSGGSATDEDFENRLRKSKFLDYAAKHWGEHASSVQGEAYGQICSFLLDEGSISSASQVSSFPTHKGKGYSQKYFKETTILHLTAQFGLSLIAEKILPYQIHEVPPAFSDKDSHGQTPLYLAAEHGHLEMAKLLLDNGADIEARGGFYDSALTAASFGGHEQTVRLLLDNGADVNAEGKFYGNALEAASERGHEQIVRLLLDNGAEVDAQGGHFGNALGAAGGNGHVGVVKLLLDAGSDLKSFDFGYGSFLNFLAFKDDTELLQLIYDQYYGTPISTDSYGRTPLLLAARGGNINAFQYLLSLGFDPSVTDKKGENLLHYASSGGSLVILNAVLHMDCVSRTNSEHWSPIHWACRHGDYLLVERLVRKGIRSTNVTVSKPEGRWSPISIAMFHGEGEMLKQLSDYTMSLLDTGKDAVRLDSAPNTDFEWDGCFHVIYGPRFHCRTCSNFDYCFMCNPFFSHLHEDHEWECSEPPIQE